VAGLSKNLQEIFDLRDYTLAKNDQRLILTFLLVTRKFYGDTLGGQ